MYTRLIQGYEAMEPELKTASASAARYLRLMVRTYLLPSEFISSPEGN